MFQLYEIVDVYNRFEKFSNLKSLNLTRIAPALLGVRQALKISIYDYRSKFHQINAELFLNCYDAIILIAVDQ